MDDFTIFYITAILLFGILIIYNMYISFRPRVHRKCGYKVKKIRYYSKSWINYDTYYCKRCKCNITIDKNKFSA